jgi:hypothetical protein
MPTPLQFKAPFFAQSFYHIVCKSIDGLLLFRNPEDYVVFHAKFRQFNLPFFEVWSYSLLSNHTHHIIKVAPAKLIADYLNRKRKSEKTMSMNSFLKEPGNEEILDVMLERQMNSFLVSYANYYNNQYQRKGGLFQKPFKRIEIPDDAYLQQAIIYTTANAQKHNLVKDFASYKYSSYKETLQDGNTWIARKEVIDFFGGKEQFEKLHIAQVDYYYKNNWPSSKLE